MNPADLIVIAIIAVIVFLAIRRIRLNRQSGCSCGCGGCSKPCAVREDTKPCCCENSSEAE